METYQTNDYREGSADAYAFVIQKLMREALDFEGFTLDHSIVDGEIVYLSLDWVDSHGRKHYRTLWEKPS